MSAGLSDVSRSAKTIAALQRSRISDVSFVPLTAVSSAAEFSAGRVDYSITSSARARSVGGTVSPSALAVFRLMTSSNLVGRAGPAHKKSGRLLWMLPAARLGRYSMFGREFSNQLVAGCSSLSLVRDETECDSIVERCLLRVQQRHVQVAAARTAFPSSLLPVTRHAEKGEASQLGY